MSYNAAEIIERLEQLNGRKLGNREMTDVEIWEKGRRLATTASSEGWPVLMELFEGYVVKAVEELVKADPKDKDEVLTSHIVAFVTSRFLRIVKEDVAAWIETGRQTPPVMKQAIDQSKLEL